MRLCRESRAREAEQGHLRAVQRTRHRTARALQRARRVREGRVGCRGVK